MINGNGLSPEDGRNEARSSWINTFIRGVACRSRHLRPRFRVRRAECPGRFFLDLAASRGPGTGCPKTNRSSGARDERVRPTLLVVDDERDVLNSVRDWLRIDYRVITFQRGAEALDYLRTGQVADVILSDQRMPEMTGVEVLCQAKAIRPETTRLLFTAYIDIRTVIDAINQGNVFRYIAKPCDPDELAVVVRQAVEHHHLIVEKNRLVAELKESNARLLEANRLKGAFIEVASHELNTPVTVVLGMIELWKMSQGPTASPQERQWVDRIGAAAGRLARTVEKMLKLVRNRDFSQSVDAQPIELEPLVRQAIDDLAPYLDLRGQAVSVSIEPDLGLIEVDSVQDLRRADESAGQRGQIHAGRRHDPDRNSSRAHGRRLGSRLHPRPGGGRCRSMTSSISSSRFSRASTRCAIPPATTSSASEESGLGSGWSRRLSNCTGAGRGLEHPGRRLDLLVHPPTVDGRVGESRRPIRPASDSPVKPLMPRGRRGRRRFEVGLRNLPPLASRDSSERRESQADPGVPRGNCLEPWTTDRITTKSLRI